jgi:hypothetical protein
VELALADRDKHQARIDGVRAWCKEMMRKLDLKDSDEEDSDDEDGGDSDGEEQHEEHAPLPSALALEIRRLESKLLPAACKPFV